MKLTAAILFVLASLTQAAGLTQTLSPPQGSPLIGDHIGAHDLHFPAVVIPPRAAHTFSLRITPNTPTTIELEELHTRIESPTAYLISANGKPHSLRTWPPAGAGPVHHFLDLPASPNDTIELRLENLSDSPLHIGRVWSFSDFPAHAAAANLDVPFHIAPTVKLTWTDPAADLATLRTLAATLKDHPHARPAWTTHIAYARWPDDRVRNRIDAALKLARDANLPVQLSFDSWWASTPTGKWRAEEFQQVVWDDTTKTMGLSTPNRWANTPWLTLTHPDLNAFKSRRLQSATAYLATRHNELTKSNQSSPLLAINLENEPAYWASGHAGLGDHLLLADFNPTTVASAKNDGVILDPRDGLSKEERLWLAKNLLRYHALIASAAAKGLSTSADNAGNLLCDNIYTQAILSPYDEYPTCDPAYPTWESAAPSDARVGGEWDANSLRERTQVTRQLPLGRLANTNAECDNLPADPHSVATAYALAHRYYTPYNTPLNSLSTAASLLSDTNAPYPSPTFHRPLQTMTFKDDAWKQSLSSHTNLTTGLIGNTPRIAAFPNDPAQPATLDLTVPNPPATLFLELTGRANDFARNTTNVRLTILAGPTPDSLIPLHTFSNTPHLDPTHPIDLSPLARKHPSLLIRLELHAPAADPATRSWSSLTQIRLSTLWLESAPTPPAPSLHLSRQRNLLITWRRDAELAITRLESAYPNHPSLPEIRSLHSSALYPAAYHLAAQSWARSQPPP